MKTESFFTNKIIEQLSSSLGDTYTVQIPANFEGYNYTPDIIIKNNNTGSMSLIECKGSSPKDELPYAIVPSLRRLKMNNNYRNSLNKIILVSLSKVSDSIKQYLSADDISLVEVSNDKQQISNQIKDIILNSDK